MRMVVILGPDDNYFDSLRIPCFVLPQIYQWLSKTTSDPRHTEWHQVCLGDRPRLAPGLSSLGGSGSDPLSHLALSGLTARVLVLAWPVMLRGIPTVAYREEDPAWATPGFKVRSSQSTCLGSCSESVWQFPGNSTKGEGSGWPGPNPSRQCHRSLPWQFLGLRGGLPSDHENPNSFEVILLLNLPWLGRERIMRK